ncbi:hypothetical protein CDAR_425471 [Caerostris darwini]|uniref:Uncharacterized protein n=1 Tax=Caerostris darwini TaxID=1538125 RepID=A0AAV4VDK5_9ARAC|nr:hypothetical protein CDAR_425471 [Caerostris darwini]
MSRNILIHSALFPAYYGILIILCNVYPFGYAVEISGFPEPSFQASPLIHPCVKTFVSAFTDYVESSEILANVFDTSLTTPKDF